MHKLNRPVLSCKLPRVMQRHIRATMDIFGISGLPITMVSCLHQCNVYAKRKLRVWRAQKCNLLVGTSTAPTGTVLQTTLCHTALYRANNGNFRKFGATCRHGTVFAPLQCLYCNETTGVRSPKMQFSSRCNNFTDWYGPANYHVSCSAV